MNALIFRISLLFFISSLQGCSYISDMLPRKAQSELTLNEVGLSTKYNPVFELSFVEGKKFYCHVKSETEFTTKHENFTIQGAMYNSNLPANDYWQFLIADNSLHARAIDLPNMIDSWTIISDDADSLIAIHRVGHEDIESFILNRRKGFAVWQSSNTSAWGRTTILTCKNTPYERK